MLLNRGSSSEVALECSFSRFSPSFFIHSALELPGSCRVGCWLSLVTVTRPEASLAPFFWVSPILLNSWCSGLLRLESPPREHPQHPNKTFRPDDPGGFFPPKSFYCSLLSPGDGYNHPKPSRQQTGEKTLDSRHWNTKTQGTQGSAAVP